MIFILENSNFFVWMDSFRRISKVLRGWSSYKKSPDFLSWINSLLGISKIFDWMNFLWQISKTIRYIINFLHVISNQSIKHTFEYSLVSFSSKLLSLMSFSPFSSFSQGTTHFFIHHKTSCSGSSHIISPAKEKKKISSYIHSISFHFISSRDNIWVI